MLESEVAGERLVTRHVLGQNRRNIDDLLALKSEIGAVRLDVGTLGTLKQDVGTLKQDMGIMREDVAAIRAALAPREPPTAQH